MADCFPIETSVEAFGVDLGCGLKFGVAFSLFVAVT